GRSRRAAPADPAALIGRTWPLRLARRSGLLPSSRNRSQRRLAMTGDNNDVRPDQDQETDPPHVKERDRRIRALNDRLRCLGQGGKFVITAGIAALPATEVMQIVRAVQTFGKFAPENDPWGEHDCAVITVGTHRVIWKIDYFDPSCRWG